MNDRRDRIPEDFVESTPSYIDGQPFRHYCELIRRIIASADHALCTREIHAELGKNAKTEWIADALDMINGIEAVSLSPTRYRLAGRPDIPLMASQKSAMTSSIGK